VPTTGTYFLRVEAYESNAGGGTGGYALNTSEVDLSALDPVDSIDWGSKLASKNVTVYFAKPGEVFDGVASLGWTDYEIEKAMEAFQTWADVTDLSFSISQDSGAATFKLVTTASADYLGYFNPPGTENAGVGVFAVTGTGWDRLGTDGGLEQGGYGFITLIHEFGHGIGLAHPHDNGGTSQIMPGVTGPFSSYGAFDLNQGVYTTMSYNDGWQLHPDAEEGSPPGSPTAWGYQGGPGAFDIAISQAKYGADAARNTGATVYTLPTENVAGTFWNTIWDTSGIDSIVHNGTVSSTIDLTAATLDYSATGAGVISYADGIFGGFTIAGGVVIENATGGSGVDLLIGNAAANSLNGRGGADTMIGRGGNDTYRVDAAGDSIQETAANGDDRVNATVSYTLGAGVHVETLGTANAAGAEALTLSGNELNNSVYGNAGANGLNGGGGNDYIVGLGGNDRLYGGAGADNLRGGAGDDSYRMDDASDTIFEAAGEGNDSVSASVSYTLNAGASVETIGTTNGAGTEAISLTGNELNNSIYANAGDNALNGGAGGDSLHGLGGNDTLSGGAGSDNLRGGAGLDFFKFDSALNPASNVDRIFDFSVADDTIQLDDAVFAGLGLGALAAGAFATGAAAADDSDRIVYNSATGALMFDADGSGAGAAVRFATLEPALSLTANDFAVI
jgi:Ca2+-binding RTX toxin-like protein